MDDCPLVRLNRNLKIHKKFEEYGKVAIPIAEWSGFFESLAYLNREGGQIEIYCAIQDGFLFFSKTPFKRAAKSEPTQGGYSSDEPVRKKNISLL